jgi:type I restriction enzyme, S subunit
MNPLEEKKKEAATIAAGAAARVGELIKAVTGYKHALMAELVMRGDGHTKFKASPCGEIPDSWTTAPLGGLLVPHRGLVEGKATGALSLEAGEGALLLTPESVESLRFRPERCRRIPQGFEASDDAAAFDIVMVRRGRASGACAIMPMSFAGGVLAPECARLTVDMRCADPFYLNNVLHHFYHAGVMDELRVNSDDTELGMGLLLKLCVPLPPPDEQKAIALKLLEFSGMIVEAEDMAEKLLGFSRI